MSTISRNIYWSILTSTLQLYTGSVIFIVLAKIMSVEDFGILSFGFSLSAIAVVVADFGFSLMIMKDYPEQSNPNGYISRGIAAKGVLAVLSSIAFFIYVAIFYKGQWFLVGTIYLVFALVASFTIYFQALLRVQNRFNKYAETGVVYALAITLTIVVYWYFPLSLKALALLFLGAKLLQLAWAFICCSKPLQFWSIKSKGIYKLIKNSWSYGVFGVLGIVYFMVDTQLISIYLGAREVALYQSVFRIVLILMVFSDIVSNVLLPYLSFKFFKKENVSELVSKIFLYLLIIGCSWFLLFTSFKTEILSILYTPDYIEASILVLPFAIVIVLRTVATLLGNVLTISNGQTARVLTVTVSLVLSFGLNLYFIPKYGIQASAWISVFVHTVLFAMYWVYSKKELRGMRLITFSSTFLILMTVALGYVTNLSGTSIWIVLLCIVIWIASVAFIMSQNNNFAFLALILRERGTG